MAVAIVPGAHEDWLREVARSMAKVRRSGDLHYSRSGDRRYDVRGTRMGGWRVLS